MVQLYKKGFWFANQFDLGKALIIFLKLNIEAVKIAFMKDNCEILKPDEIRLTEHVKSSG